MDRRDALRLLTTGAAWPLADQLLSRDLLAFGQAVHDSVAADTTFRALSPQQVRTLTTACDRIIPADDTAGAVAAGVPAFIDRMLADWYPPADRDRFLEGLATLDDRSRAAHRKLFVECTQRQQVALLEAIDNELAQLEKPAPAAGSDQVEPVRRPATTDATTVARAHWFRMLKYLTIWGYCTSEVGMSEELRIYPQAFTYDGNAPYTRRRGASTPGGGDQS